MIKFEPGESYAWIFWLYLLLFSMLAFGLSNHAKWVAAAPAIIAPLLLSYILASELSSGVALNSFWRAEHVRGSWQYRATVIWHTVGIVIFLVVAYFAIR